MVGVFKKKISLLVHIPFRGSVGSQEVLDLKVACNTMLGEFGFLKIKPLIGKRMFSNILDFIIGHNHDYTIQYI